MLRFLFDRNLTKYWLPVTTQWFANIAKEKEFTTLFGKFCQCLLSYRQFFELHQPQSPHFTLEEKEYLSLNQLRFRLTELQKGRQLDLSSILDDCLTSSMGKIKFEGLGICQFFLWTFSYIYLDASGHLKSKSPVQDDEAT